MIKFKVCPRCRGDVCLREDIFGKYLSCLQCGYLRDLEVLYPPSKREDDVGIDKEYKAA
jgi:hypothetical protein